MHVLHNPISPRPNPAKKSAPMIDALKQTRGTCHSSRGNWKFQVFLFIFMTKRWEWMCSSNCEPIAKCLLLSKYHRKFNVKFKRKIYKQSKIKLLRLNWSCVLPDTKTQKPNGKKKKTGTYPPTDAVAQPLGV